MSVLQISRRFAPLLRYGIVGLSSTVVDFGVLALLTDVLSWQPLAANPVAFVLGLTNGFYWNRRWTFPEAGRTEPIRQYVRFTLVNLVGLALDQSILATALALGPTVGLSADLAKWGGKTIAIPFVFVWNYTANSRWTFGKR